MLALGVPQHMILAPRPILAGHALVLLLLQAVLAHVLLQLLVGLVVAIAVLALHEGVPRQTSATAHRSTVALLAAARGGGGVRLGDGGVAAVIIVVIVEMIAIELVAGIGTGTGWAARRGGVHAQEAAQDGVDVCWWPQHTHGSTHTALGCR